MTWARMARASITRASMTRANMARASITRASTLTALLFCLTAAAAAERPSKLKAISATMSSTYDTRYPAGRCIDGGEGGLCGLFSLCITNGEKAPWLALEFEAEVSVEKIAIHNRDDCCGDRLRNAEVWVADQLPTSGQQMFSGGQLLGTYRGPARTGEVITLTSSAQIGGRFVIVQIDNSPGTGYLNFNEVTVWGKETGPPLKAISATMSSTYGAGYTADKCIDGGVSGWSNACGTTLERAPWLALDFRAHVIIDTVVIHNLAFFKNAKIWVADQLPDSGQEMFSGGQLLASYRGPASYMEVITLTASAEIGGRFVIVQLDKSPRTGYLFLQEVTVWGKEKGLCGWDASIDRDRLLGEQNAAYIFGALDSTNEDDIGHRTQVFDFIVNQNNGETRLEVESFPLIAAYTAGLFSVILVPPRSQCNRGTFEDAATNQEGYYPVFIGANFKMDLKEVHDRFLLKVMSLKPFYKDTIPKLCASFTPMSSEHATNRAATMNKIFNFFLSGDREIEIDKEKECPTATSTFETISKSEIYDTRADFHFKEETGDVIKDVGLVKVVISGPAEEKSIIGQVETELVSADNTDIVAKQELFVIDKRSVETSVFVAVKRDTVDKESKEFKVVLKHIESSDGRRRRSDVIGLRRKHTSTFRKLKPTFDGSNCDSVLAEIGISREDVRVGRDNTLLYSTPDPSITPRHCQESSIQAFIDRNGNQQKKTLEMTTGGQKLLDYGTWKEEWEDGAREWNDKLETLWLCLSKWFAEEATGAVGYFGENAVLVTPRLMGPHKGIPAFFNAELPVLLRRKRENDQTLSGLHFLMCGKNTMVTDAGQEKEATKANMANRDNHINLETMHSKYYGHSKRERWPVHDQEPEEISDLSVDDAEVSKKIPVSRDDYKEFSHSDGPNQNDRSIASMRQYRHSHYIVDTRNGPYGHAIDNHHAVAHTIILGLFGIMLLPIIAAAFVAAAVAPEVAVPLAIAALPL